MRIRTALLIASFLALCSPSAARAQVVMGSDLVPLHSTVTLTVVGPPPPSSMAVARWYLDPGEDKVSLTSTGATASVTGEKLSTSAGDVAVHVTGIITQVSPGGGSFTYPFTTTKTLTVVDFKISGPRGVAVGKRITLGVPPLAGATYHWAFEKNAGQAGLVGGSDATVAIDGLSPSLAEGDVVIGVTVTVGETTLTAVYALTMVELVIVKPTAATELVYHGSPRKSSTLDADTLATVKPGTLADKLRWSIAAVADSHMPGATGKLVSLKWRTPCADDALLGCGAANRASFTGMPDRNADFGTKRVTVALKELDILEQVDPAIFFDPRDTDGNGKAKVPLWYFFFSADGRPGDAGVCSFNRTAGAAGLAGYGGKGGRAGGEYFFLDDTLVLYDGALDLNSVDYDANTIALHYDFSHAADAIEHAYWHERWHQWIAGSLKVAATASSSGALMGADHLNVKSTANFRPTGTLYAHIPGRSDPLAVPYLKKEAKKFNLVEHKGKTDAGTPLAANVAADLLVTDRVNRAVSFDWHEGSDTDTSDIELKARNGPDGAPNRLDPDDDEDWLPDGFEALLNTEFALPGLFRRDQPTSPGFKSPIFPFSFDDSADGDQAPFIEWRLSKGFIPDTTDRDHWQGDTSPNSPQTAAHPENDWSACGHNSKHVRTFSGDGWVCTIPK